MMNFLFGDSWLILAIILVATFLVYGLIKYNKIQFLGWILCIAYIILGGYSAMRYVIYNKSTSVTIGTPEIHDPYEDFNFFEYDLSNIVWYEVKEGGFDYKTEYATHLDFNGDEHKYHVLVNNEPCTETTSTTGRLNAVLKKKFKDIDGAEIKTIKITFDFAFYSSRIEIHIVTDASKDDIGLLREYVKMNGFNLRIIDRIYNSTMEV